MTESIGISFPRQEAWSKVSGEAAFIADESLPRCLEGKVLRSPYPYAEILHVDTGKARKLKGVSAVITARDLPHRRLGNCIADRPVLASSKVLFFGERVAAVAAEDADTAAEALSLIEVDYRELPSVIDPMEAMKPGAPVLHPERSSYRGNRKVPALPGIEVRNVVDYLTYSLGDIRQGFDQSDLVLEHVFRTQMVHQGYLEPHFSAVAILGEKRVRVWTNNKQPFQLRADLAAILGLSQSDVEVIYRSIGGDFGGKGAMMDEPVCFYLARASGRPVRIVMTVEEELCAANPRHGAIITLRSGLRRDGELLARQAQVIFNSGAYAGANVQPIVHGFRRSLGAYRIPHTLLEGFAVYTNSIPAGHCRAPGDPQVFFAAESHTDMVAEAVGLDPYEFRRRNALRPGDESPTGLRWEGINAVEVLDQVAHHARWGKIEKASGIGVGMALTERATGAGEAAATVALYADGSATVLSGATDPGTGSRTVLRQIAAQELELPLDRVSFTGGNTLSAPFDSGSGASRVTHVTGQAVLRAARDVIAQMKKMVAQHWNVSERDVYFQEGSFSSSTFSNLSIQEVLLKAGKAKSGVSGHGSYAVEGGETTCFSADVAKVRVDHETGQVEVLEIDTVHDIGRALNPLSVKGQVEGAVLQGLGFALNEVLPNWDGLPAVRSLADYRPATILDSPEVRVHLLEGAPGPGPYGAKAIGEQGISAIAPAIANAIYDVAGVRILDLPITPEKIVDALKAKETQRRKRAISDRDGNDLE
jgi:carbon-monoxide dehydrogenase large subunit